MHQENGGQAVEWMMEGHCVMGLVFHSIIYQIHDKGCHEKLQHRSPYWPHSGDECMVILAMIVCLPWGVIVWIREKVWASKINVVKNVSRYYCDVLLQDHSTPTLHMLGVHLQTHPAAHQLASTVTDAQTHPPSCRRPSSER